MTQVTRRQGLPLDPHRLTADSADRVRIPSRFARTALGPRKQRSPGPLRPPSVSDMRRSGPAGRAGDRHWRGSARLAVSCAMAFCAMALLVDWDAGSLTPLRALLWAALSAAVFAVLLPARVSAGPGWLAVRTPWRRHLVHTDALTVVRQYDGVPPTWSYGTSTATAWSWIPASSRPTPCSGTSSTRASAAPWSTERCGTARMSWTDWATASTTRRCGRCSGHRDFPDLTLRVCRPCCGASVLAGGT